MEWYQPQAIYEILTRYKSPWIGVAEHQSSMSFENL